MYFTLETSLFCGRSTQTDHVTEHSKEFNKSGRKNREIARILKFLEVSVLLCLSFFFSLAFSVKVHSVPKSKRTALQAVGRSSFEK